MAHRLELYAHALKVAVESDIYSTVSLWHITMLSWSTPRLSRPPSMTKCARRSYNSDCNRPYLVDNDEWLSDWARFDLPRRTFRSFHAKKSF
ncbi:Uncharacterized protein APZ42_018331 [Daphnia magna]|uniref:Uncharacterized protein n=1 Tax=Daphnia magna TaxID=35525 RepID=A0A0N8DCW5_9CRUS|nr:Uncharacterized protein APZ42_018331 [Daphnia magna]